MLGTQATVSREYTRALIREFATGCDVVLVGSPRLAGYAEAELAGHPVTDADIAAEIAACFVDADGRRTDTVVLACTHYPLLIERFRATAPWPVDWLDPAPAIARRVAALLQDGRRRRKRRRRRLSSHQGKRPRRRWRRRCSRSAFSCRRTVCNSQPPRQIMSSAT